MYCSCLEAKVAVAPPGDANPDRARSLLLAEACKDRRVLVTNHVLAGAIIGRALARHPVAAFGAGVVSHFAMDACPHWGDGRREMTDEFLHVARCDGCAGLAAMTVSAGLTPGHSRKAVLGGMLGGAVVDADKPCQYFFGFNPFPRVFQRFHQRIQREAPHRLPHEVMTGVALAVLTLSVLGRTNRRP